jgi:hypothetical protein
MLCLWLRSKELAPLEMCSKPWCNAAKQRSRMIGRSKVTKESSWSQGKDSVAH